MLHGGGVAARQIQSEGVDVVFTLPGGHLSPFYDGCETVGLPLVGFRHEQAAVHAADAYARLQRRPSIVAVTAGPGATNAVTGIANARDANSPVVLVTGRNQLSTLGMGALQDTPQLDVFRPLVKWAETVPDLSRMADLIHTAFAVAESPRPGPVMVDLPFCVQMTGDEDDALPVAVGRRWSSLPACDPEAVAEVARLLAEARRPVFFAGSGVYWAKAEEALRRLLEEAPLPLCVNGMGRGLLPPNHPGLVVRARRRALSKADLVVVLGADFDFRLGYGSSISTDNVVQVDPDLTRLGRTRAVIRGIAGDICSFLVQLTKHVRLYGNSAEHKAWRDELAAEETVLRLKAMAVIEEDRIPIHPLRLAAELAHFVNEDAVVIGDGGDIVTLAAPFLPVGRPGHWLDPGPLGCLGVGIPFAIAARLARPNTQVIALLGDGAFGFNALEIETAVRYRLPFIGVIGNDGAWGQMVGFHAELFGPGRAAAQDLAQSARYDLLTQALGGWGERVERPQDIRPALERAAASGLPAILDVVLDRSVRREGGTVSGAALTPTR